MPRGNNPLVPFILIYLENLLICFLVYMHVYEANKLLLAFYRLHFLLLACFAFLPPIFFVVGRLVGLIRWEKLPRTNRGSWTKLLERNLAQAGSGTRFLEECFGQFYMAYSVFLWPFWLNHARFWYGWKKMRSLLSCASWCQSCPRPLELMTSEVMHARLCSKENWRESSALKL